MLHCMPCSPIYCFFFSSLSTLSSFLVSLSIFYVSSSSSIRCLCHQLIVSLLSLSPSLFTTFLRIASSPAAASLHCLPFTKVKWMHPQVPVTPRSCQHLFPVWEAVEGTGPRHVLLLGLKISVEAQCCLVTEAFCKQFIRFINCHSEGTTCLHPAEPGTKEAVRPQRRLHWWISQ